MQRKPRSRNPIKPKAKKMKFEIGGVKMDVSIQHVWADNRGDRWAAFYVGGLPYLSTEVDAQ